MKISGLSQELLKEVLGRCGPDGFAARSVSKAFRAARRSSLGEPLPRAAAVGGGAALLEHAMLRCGLPADLATFEAIVAATATEEEALELLEWCAAQSFWRDARLRVCNLAAKHGRPGVLRWALEKGCPRDRNDFMLAARGGHLAVLQCLHDNAPSPDWYNESYKSSPCASAAGGGHLAVLEWLFEKGYRLIDEITCSSAAAGGHLAVLQWLRGRDCPWEAQTCAKAAMGGHLAVLQWARANGCPWDAWTCANAARGGHLGLLQWARQNACPWNVHTCSHAARGGHLEVLQWARANGCPWREWTCSGAAEGGHFAVLKWLRDNGCPWDEWTCAHAAGGGHLAVLQWARANGCPWDESTCSCAAYNGHLAVLQWASENGCPCRDLIYEDAAECGSIETLQWLSETRCPFPWGEGACLRAAFRGRVAALRWLLERGCPWDVKSCFQVACNNETACREAIEFIREWMHANPPVIAIALD